MPRLKPYSPLHVPLRRRRQETLEPAIVVQGHLVLHVIVAVVGVVVIGVRPAHQGAVQHVRVGAGVVQGLAAARGGKVGAGGAAVVRLLRRVHAEAAHEAAAGRAQDVVQLGLGGGADSGTLDAVFGGLTGWDTLMKNYSRVFYWFHVTCVHNYTYTYCTCMSANQVFAEFLSEPQSLRNMSPNGVYCASLR